MKVGVLAVQGAVSEHHDALRLAAAAADMDVEITTVRDPADLERVAGLVMPGGESTTISRLLRATGLHDPVHDRAAAGELAVFGTCAGMILLASKATHDVDDKDIRLLSLLDATVDRNAFGRQKDSFEAALDVDGIGETPAVFIRAPAYDAVGDGVEVLATFKGRIVAAAQDNILAAAFHPELTPDTRLHERFLRMAKDVRH